MAIDILNIQPSVISRDLKGKFLCIYGPEKCGKTTFCAQQEGTLICAFEIGTNFLSGIKVAPISKWLEFKQIVRQLEKPEAKAMYQCIAIDTVAEAYQACEDYICNQNAVQKIGDLPYGQGYAMTKKEFETTLRKITMLGYGMICVCHSQIKNEADGDNVIEHISPAMPARAADVVNRMVDVIGYIKTGWDEKGNATRTLLTRSTPTILAGSRLKYLSPEIPFGYHELVNAIADAIQKQEDLDGALTADHVDIISTTEKLDYDVVRDEARKLWSELVKKDEENADRVLKKIEIAFGRKMKLSEITEDQVEIFADIVEQMKEMLN